MNRVHTRGRIRVWLALGGALFASGCWDRDECGSPKCIGNMLQVCTSASYGASYELRACNGTCRVDPTTQEPFCALDDEPDAICAGYGDRHCDDTAVVSCRAGYETARLDCASEGAALGLEPGPDGTITCVDSPFASGAECSIAGNPDRRCNARSVVSHFCDGDVRVDCYGRYPVRRRECQGNPVCDTTCTR